MYHTLEISLLQSEFNVKMCTGYGMKSIAPYNLHNSRYCTQYTLVPGDLHGVKWSLCYHTASPKIQVTITAVEVASHPCVRLVQQMHAKLQHGQLYKIRRSEGWYPTYT